RSGRALARPGEQGRVKARFTVVGEAPARVGNRRAFCPTTASGRFLRRLLGNALSKAKVANLLRRWPGEADSKGAAFPLEEAREAAAKMRLPRAPVVDLARERCAVVITHDAEMAAQMPAALRLHVEAGSVVRG
ncbi:MAG TPA: hypothetical protein VJ608_10575, partial [Albitalea sp.]|nr:hypothetical protein [Albitalea sp.]